MKKILFLSICLALCTKYCYAINVFPAFKYAANKAINIVNNPYFDIIVDIVDIGEDFIDITCQKNEKNTSSQSTTIQSPDNVTNKLLQIRQTIADLIINHADSKIGVYGLPVVCDAEIKKLISLPGGQEVLKELQELFEKFFKTKAAAPCLTSKK
jgi:hypothetical protein